MGQGTQKSLGLRDELASELKVRLSALAQVKSIGSLGEAELLVGAGTAGSDSVFVRISAISTINKDVLGLSQNVFTPHVAQVVVEGNVTAGAGADIGTWATRLAVLGCLVAKGVKVELYVRATGNAAAAAGITGAPTASFEIHPQYPMMSSI